MKHQTMNDINVLMELRNAKKARMEHIEQTVKRIRSTYKDMTDDELLDAVIEVRSLMRELDEEKVWCSHADSEIAKFFAPATVD